MHADFVAYWTQLSDTDKQRHDVQHTHSMAMHSAVAQHNNEQLRFLLDLGFPMTTTLATVLRKAVEERCAVAARMVLDMPQWDSSQNTSVFHDAFCRAVEGNDVDMAQLFLDYGVDANASDGWPLMSAAGNGCVAMVELLLARGGDLARYGFAALDAAVEHGQKQTFSLLLTHKAPLCTSMQSALATAVECGQHDMAHALLAAGADPTHHYSYALQQACAGGDHMMIDLLYGLSNPHEALQVMGRAGVARHVLALLTQRIDAEHTRAMLDNAVNTDTHVPEQQSDERVRRMI